MAFAHFERLLKRPLSFDQYFDIVRCFYTKDWVDYIAARRTADDIKQAELTTACLAKRFGTLTTQKMRDLVAKLDREFLLDWYEPKIRYMPDADTTMSRHTASERELSLVFVMILAWAHSAGLEVDESWIESKVNFMFRSEQGPEVQAEKKAYVARMEGVWRCMDDEERGELDCPMLEARRQAQLEIVSLIRRHERREEKKAQIAWHEQESRRQRHEPEPRQHYDRQGARAEPQQLFNREGMPRASGPPTRTAPRRSSSAHRNARSRESLASDEANVIESSYERDLLDDGEYSDEEYAFSGFGRVQVDHDRREDGGRQETQVHEERGRTYGLPGRSDGDAVTLDTDRHVDGPPPPYTAMPPEAHTQHSHRAFGSRNVDSRPRAHPEGSSSSSHPRPRYEPEVSIWAGLHRSAEPGGNMSQRFELPGDTIRRSRR